MNNNEETRIQINNKKTKENWILQSAMDKNQENIGHKRCDRKSNRFEKEKLLYLLCNKQLDDSH